MLAMLKASTSFTVTMHEVWQFTGGRRVLIEGNKQPQRGCNQIFTHQKEILNLQKEVEIMKAKKADESKVRLDYRLVNSTYTVNTSSR